MITGWILKLDRGTQQLYRLDAGRAPFVIDPFSQYSGPGTARPIAWGCGGPSGGARTAAWILCAHSTEDNRLADYLTYGYSVMLSSLSPDKEYFISDEAVGDFCYELMENLYGTVDIA